MPRYHRSPIQTSPFFHRQRTMPSPRRVKLFTLLLIVLIITILFYTSSFRQSSSSLSDTFYSKTVNGLKDKSSGHPHSSTGGTGEDDEEVARQMALRLKEAAQVAKDKANAKAPKPDPPSAVIGKGSAAEGADKSVAGRKKFGGDGEKEKQEVVKEVEEEEETPEELEIKSELNGILKKSPIIIFSKSYCPYSRRAKGVLMEKYVIDPPPYVVELDQHPLGARLQAKLGELTNRRTVPNILVNGVSIGGGDDIGELDTNKKLVDKIKELGGSKIVDMKLRDIEAVGEEKGL